MNDIWISLPVDSVSFDVLAIIVVSVMVIGCAGVIMGMIMDWGEFFVGLFAVLFLTGLASVFIFSSQPVRDTRSILTTEYGIPDMVAENLAKNLFTDEQGEKHSSPQRGEVTTTFPNQDEGTVVEYRLLSNGESMKLQSRTVSDTEGDWVDAVPNSSK